MGNALLIPARAGDTAVLPKIVIIEMDKTAICSFKFREKLNSTSCSKMTSHSSLIYIHKYMLTPPKKMSSFNLPVFSTVSAKKTNNLYTGSGFLHGSQTPNPRSWHAVLHEGNKEDEPVLCARRKASLPTSQSQ